MHTLPPGNCFRFVLDGQERGGLVLADAPSVPAPKLREIKVLAVADIEYRNRFPDWQERVKGLVGAASRYYESEFGLRFTVLACKPWEFNARYQPSMEEKLVSLQKIELGQADLLIAFVRSVQHRENGAAIGWGFWLCEYMLVTDLWPELVDGAQLMPLVCRQILKKPGFGSTMTLIHELGHLFGAFHVDNAESIMYFSTMKIVPPRIQFDDVNRQVILATRDVDFRVAPEGLPRASALKIRDLYRAHHVRTEPADLDPITTAYRYRAMLALISQNRPLANRLALQSAAWWRGAEAPPPVVRDHRRDAMATKDIDRMDSLLVSVAAAKLALSSSSTEPVLLRYRFRAGENFQFATEARSRVEVLAGPTAGRILIATTRAYGEADVKAVSAEGNADLVLTVARAVVTGADGRSIDVGRDGAAGQPALVPLAAMINHSFAVTITPTGRVLRSGMRALAEEVRRRGGELALRHLGPALESIVSNAFLRLPEDPLKSGDAFDPGDHRARLPDGREVRTAMSCRLSGVAADRKMAMLDLTSRTTYPTPGDSAAKVALDQAAVNGWFLFDLEKGKLTRSYWHFESVLTASDGSNTAKMKKTDQTTYVFADEAPSTRP